MVATWLDILKGSSVGITMFLIGLLFGSPSLSFSLYVKFGIASSAFLCLLIILKLSDIIEEYQKRHVSYPTPRPYEEMLKELAPFVAHWTSLKMVAMTPVLLFETEYTPKLGDSQKEIDIKKIKAEWKDKLIDRINNKNQILSTELFASEEHLVAELEQYDEKKREEILNGWENLLKYNLHVYVIKPKFFPNISILYGETKDWLFTRYYTNIKITYGQFQIPIIEGHNQDKLNMGWHQHLRKSNKNENVYWICVKELKIRNIPDLPNNILALTGCKKDYSLRHHNNYMDLKDFIKQMREKFAQCKEGNLNAR
jgi:hypothetical protein